MSLVEPFRGLRVVPEFAAAVAAPPYDVLDSEEARALAADAPDSFLHVSKAEIDLPPGTDPHDDVVLRRSRENLDALVARGRLRRDEHPSLYLYRLVMGEHTQLGLVAATSVAAYREGRIKRHEHTKEDKVVDRARHAEALQAHTGAIFLTYRADAGLDGMMATIAKAAPEIDLVAPDGVRHTLWVVADPTLVSELVERVEALDALYIADGHHRSEAAARVAEWHEQALARGETTEPADRFLGVMFPDDQVRILAYNRVVSSLNDHTPDSLLAALAEAFDVAAADEPVAPERPGTFGMYLGGRWYRLSALPGTVPEEDPVARLDINVLERGCLAPLLGITDQRKDPRIDFVGGIRGLGELERRVDSGSMQVAFSLVPTRLQDVFAVADAGEVMPPKSTWFEPKLRDGLVLLPFAG